MPERLEPAERFPQKIPINRWAIRWAFCAAAHLYELPPITDSPRVEVSSDCWRPTDYRHRVLCIGVERGGAP